MQALFAADRTLAPQLGLAPLDNDDAQARDAAYEADRQRLLELVALMGQKQLRVTRFARVACPARGTTLASGRLPYTTGQAISADAGMLVPRF